MIDLKTRTQVVSMLARNWAPSRIADATTLPVATIRTIGEEHGAPDMGLLAEAATRLRKEAEGDTSEPGKDVLAGLLTEAERIGSARLAGRARWLQDKIGELAGDVKTLSVRYEAAQKAEVERARILAEIDQLRAREAKLRAKAGLGRARSASGESALIRLWAQGEGIPCAEHGRIPKSVRAAYDRRDQ